MTSPNGAEYARRIFSGMSHEEASVGLYKNAVSAKGCFRTTGARVRMGALQEAADAAVVAKQIEIREKCGKALALLESVMDGSVDGEEKVPLFVRVGVAEKWLDRAGWGAVKRSEVSGPFGVIDGEFLERMKARGPAVEVEGEEVGEDGSGEVSDVC